MSVSSRNALRAALLYGLLSVVWLQITDHLLSSFFDDSAQLAHWQLINGYVWVFVSAVLIFVARSQLLGFLGGSASLKRQREDRERLRQAAAVFDCTREGVLVTDRTGAIVHVNRALVEITGYTVEEVLGKRPNMFKSGHHDLEFYQGVFKSLQETGDWHGEIWNRRKNGEIYPQWQTVRAITDEKGQLTHYVAVFTDISAIKKSQTDLARLVHHDPLTDLPNRLLFTDRTEQALTSAQRHKTGCALLMIDLDHFKIINDSLGHNVGDLLLKAVSGRLQRVFGKGYTV
ncbi:MAG: diguanylate cyclase, partial [Pseudomonas sp.]|nr:diguanylate cyclase [Pseudomonas sp.]